ncbi:hypothetical protein ACTI_83010 [Actinoplanes sp. OR16]|uniref:hypothetical protein n=1 Tax=Actinoplanes sp. OR16 TaxID=946334 RepID=UPI000F6B6E75|nr:hypothetical protein [Actinoplanes sp. OR16]BBH71616.1 hypothetical protein ACTI_83010 [Actinoplanes sp. OR16]
MDTIDSVLSAADQAWRSYGVHPPDRAALAADLRGDLEAAVADGAGPHELIGPDVAGFARRLADEAGVRRHHPTYARLFSTMLIGAALTAVIAYELVTALSPMMIRAVDLDDPARVPLVVALAVYYGIPAAIVVAGAVLAVRWRLRDLHRVRETCRAMILLLPIAGLLVTPVVMGFAWATGYSTDPVVVAFEVAMVMAALSGATYLARRWALRERQGAATPPPMTTAGPRVA